MSDENKPGSNEVDFDKINLRKQIDEEREKFLAKGGLIKRYIPPFAITNFLSCDIFVPGEGSKPSKLGLVDTMPRKPRPEKKFGKKS